MSEVPLYGAGVAMVHGVASFKGLGFRDSAVERISYI